MTSRNVLAIGYLTCHELNEQTMCFLVGLHVAPESFSGVDEGDDVLGLDVVRGG